MDVAQFTISNGQVQAELASLREHIRNKQFSDVIDSEGHQYVDLVMEGGGMLGIALVGYVYTLEQVGIRFMQLGGTSAGSINALLMAAAGPKNKAASEWLLKILANKDFSEFVDGDKDAKKFISAVIQDKHWLKLVLKGSKILDSLRDDFGLNPGITFHNWLKQVLADRGVKSLADLELKRQAANERLMLRNGKKAFKIHTASRIAFVAADITTQTKVVFPEMANLYWRNPKNVNPADFVRASMSVPLFFQPFRLANLPYGADQLKKWRDIGYTGNVPDEVFFIDGGINSNFPIDLFHDHNKLPNAPTFGVKLGIDRHRPRIVRKVPTLISAIFDSARQVHDFDFIARNPDYKHLVHCIDTEGFNWLNFNLPDQEKLKLFEAGVRGAAVFLRNFDWQEYKKMRAALMKARNISEGMETVKENVAVKA